MKGFLSSRAGQYAVLGVVIVGVYWFFKGEAKAAVVSTAKAVYPTSTGNLFYQGTNAVGDVLNNGTDDGDFSLGGWWADMFPSEAEKKFNESMRSK